MSELRTWMLAAYDMNMHNGDYVLLYPNQIIPTSANIAQFASPSFYTMGDGRDEAAKKIYESLLMVRQQRLYCGHGGAGAKHTHTDRQTHTHTHTHKNTHTHTYIYII